MKTFKKVINCIFNPGKIFTVIGSLIACILLIYVFRNELQDTLLSYIVYSFAAYTLVIFILGSIRLGKRIKSLIYRNSYGRRYLSDVEYRNTISLYLGLSINVLFAIFNFIVSWINQSVWFGAIAMYYLLLSGIRLVMTKKINKLKTVKSIEMRVLHEVYSYRHCGYMMFLLNIVMAGMIIQMIWQNRGYVYSGYTIYVLAAYSFYSLVTAFILIFRYHEKINPILSASKELKFASALMSILALQTAMLAQFNGGDFVFRKIMNTATGTGVLMIEFITAISMISRANRKIKAMDRLH